MSNPTMSTNLLQPLQILTEFIVETVGKELRVLAIDNILLSIEEPFWDFVLSGVLQDCDDSFEFLRCKLAGPKQKLVSTRTKTKVGRQMIKASIVGRRGVPLVQVDISLFDDDVCISAANSPDFCQGEHDFVLSINVRVEETQDVLECILVWDNESHGRSRKMVDA
jgi:hypothetical protein